MCKSSFVLPLHASLSMMTLAKSEGRSSLAPASADSPEKPLSDHLSQLPSPPSHHRSQTPLCSTTGQLGALHGLSQPAERPAARGASRGAGDAPAAGRLRAVAADRRGGWGGTGRGRGRGRGRSTLICELGSSEVISPRAGRRLSHRQWRSGSACIARSLDVLCTYIGLTANTLDPRLLVTLRWPPARVKNKSFKYLICEAAADGGTRGRRSLTGEGAARRAHSGRTAERQTDTQTRITETI